MIQCSAQICIKMLAEMGHDDAIVVVDANFTAMSLAAGKPVLRLPGVDMVRALRAVGRVLPLASDVAYMHVCGQALGYRSAVQSEALAVLAQEGLQDGQPQAVERFAFYDRVRSAYGIVVTGELQPWNNFSLRKGVLGEVLRA